MTTSHHMALPYAERFAALAPSLPGAGLPWLTALRQDAIARLDAHGLPTPRVEDWKYTNLNPLAGSDFSPAGDIVRTWPKGLSADLILPKDAEAHKLVFLNGRYDAALSHIGALPAGVTLTTLGVALAQQPALIEAHLGRVAALNGHAMVSLNTAFMGDGLVLVVPDGVAVEAPLHLVSAGLDDPTPAAFHPRILVVAGAGSQLTLMESHIGPAGARYWTNPVTEISVGRDAVVHHYKVQADSNAAIHLAWSRARLAAGARYESFVMSLGARLSRNEINVVFDGEGGQCRLNGGYMADGTQHVDNTTLIDHAQPNCSSREIYKGVLDGKARGVFQGRIVVHRDAQKSDGHMLNKALLLSDRAEIDAKPELEIYADDVKCGHGATAGEIDDDALFYLRARGIGDEAARNLLIEAFLQEVVDEITYAPARILLNGRVSRWLETRTRTS